MAANAEDVIGLYLEVESRLGPTLKKAAREYADFTKTIIKLHEQARKAVQAGLDDFAKIVGGFTGASQGGGRGSRRTGGSRPSSGGGIGGGGGGFGGMGVSGFMGSQTGPAKTTDVWSSLGWGNNALPKGIADDFTNVLNSMYAAQQILSGAKVGAKGAKAGLTSAVKELNDAMKQLRTTTGQYDTKDLKPVLKNLTELTREFQNLKAEMLEVGELQRGGFLGAAGKVWAGAGIGGAVIGGVGQLANTLGVGGGTIEQDNRGLASIGALLGLTPDQVQRITDAGAAYESANGFTRLDTSVKIAAAQALSQAGARYPLSAQGNPDALGVAATRLGQYSTILPGTGLNDLASMMRYLESPRGGYSSTGEQTSALALTIAKQSQVSGAPFATLQSIAGGPSTNAMLFGKMGAEAQNVQRENLSAFVAGAYAGQFGQFGAQIAQDLVTAISQGTTPAGVDANKALQRVTGHDANYYRNRLSSPDFADSLMRDVQGNLASQVHGPNGISNVIKGLSGAYGGGGGINLSPLEAENLLSARNVGGRYDILNGIRGANVRTGDVTTQMQQMLTNAFTPTQAATQDFTTQLKALLPDRFKEDWPLIEKIASGIGGILDTVKQIAEYVGGYVLLQKAWDFLGLGGAIAKGTVISGAAKAAGTTIAGDAAGAAAGGAGSSSLWFGLGAALRAVPGLAAKGLKFGLDDPLAFGVIGGEIIRQFFPQQNIDSTLKNVIRTVQSGATSGSYGGLGPPPTPSLDDIMSGKYGPVDLHPPATQPSSMVPTSLQGIPSGSDLSAGKIESSDATAHGLLKQLIGAVNSLKTGAPYSGPNGNSAPVGDFFVNLATGYA
jgi:hypothetical protein